MRTNLNSFMRDSLLRGVCPPNKMTNYHVPYDDLLAKPLIALVLRGNRTPTVSIGTLGLRDAVIKLRDIVPNINVVTARNALLASRGSVDKAALLLIQCRPGK